jgi:hypothetical protein
MDDPMGLATKRLGIPGVRVFQVDPLKSFTRFHLETTMDAARCLSCGADAVLSGRRERQLIDLRRYVDEGPARF